MQTNVFHHIVPRFGLPTQEWNLEGESERPHDINDGFDCWCEPIAGDTFTITGDAALTIHTVLHGMLPYESVGVIPGTSSSSIYLTPPDPED